MASQGAKRQLASLSRPVSCQHSLSRYTQARGAQARGFAGSRTSRDNAYILSAARTPVGVFNGSFTTISAPTLGSIAIRSALSKSSIPSDRISEVLMGQVLQGGSGQAPARQAAIAAGIPPTVEATTVNKVCSSGLKAVTLASQSIQLGQSHAVVAGGMENMTRVPYYLSRASQLPAFGDVKMQDGLIVDGLWDVYNQIHMGNCAENTAKKHDISRKDQDEYAVLSYQRAQEAYKAGKFKEEIVPVTVKGRKGDTVVEEDEQYNKLKLEKISTLKPAFDRSGNGTVTAANSSPLSDGASALVVTSKTLAQEYGRESRVLAEILGYADAAVDPIDFPVAPAKVVPLVLERAGLKQEDVQVWEFNEAFAAVILANGKILGLDAEKVNKRGGAISLGHALGSSGSRILTTLLHQLEDGQVGVAAICNGGGAATGIAVRKVAYSDL